MRVHTEQPPLRVIRAFELADGAALLHLHNVSGGVLGGDVLEVRADIGAGACVQLTTTGATRLYRNQAKRVGSTQRNDLRVGEGALLELLPDPIIPFAGSKHQQITRIELGADAGLFWWEVLTPGREARGEHFAYQSLALDAEIISSGRGRPILLDRLHLEPAARSPQSVARLGDYGYYATFVICRTGLPSGAWERHEADLMALVESLSQPGHTMWGVSTLAADGLVVRALSCEGRVLISGLVAIWKAAKRLLYGQQAIPPRKIY